MDVSKTSDHILMNIQMQNPGQESTAYSKTPSQVCKIKVIVLKGENNIHVLRVLILGFGGRWRFLTVVWHLNLDFDMVTGL